MAKRKMIILGGGIGALSTAWHVTKDPKWTDQIESLTVYQMGWRLGGKCATGRGPNGRVEEHGIHLFGGGYYNALGMMRDVYREAFGASGDAEFQHRFQNQFTSVRVREGFKGTTRFPVSPLNLDNLPTVASVDDLLGNAIDTLRGLVSDQQPTPSLLTLMRFADGSMEELRGTLSSQNSTIAPWLEDLKSLAEQVRQRSKDVPKTLARIGALAGPQRLGIDRIETYALDDESRSRLDAHEMRAALSVPRWMGILNFIYALTTGWLQDIVTAGKSFAVLDQIDFATWLTKHGAWATTIDLDIVQAPIQILYQYKDGDSSNLENRSMGAGAYIHWTIRTFAYVHSPFWFFRYGTGDTVIAPIYETLLKRGVKFEFFHKLENVGLSVDGKRIKEVELRVQATTKSGNAYEPLEAGNWPATPRFDELTEGDVLSTLPPGELESYWSKFRDVQRVKLQCGVDFDEIVFAISLGAIPILCKELIAAENDWRRMVAEVKTVETQSLQVWFDRSSQALGVNDGLDTPIAPDDTGFGCGFAKPFDGFSDFSDLIPYERWPVPTRPKALWYFSDVLQTASDVPDLSDPTYPSRRRDMVFTSAKQFLENDLGKLLSGFSQASGGFDCKRLVLTDPSRATDSDSRLKQQLIRANVQPSERYVQALAGTTQYRLDAGRSKHFANLYLAGDWTFNGLNVGCVEATVMSGMLAANDILGRLHEDGLIGYFGR
jgi:uncharacterized protein with NAD-binding domain and iron-sulfur cluster